MLFPVKDVESINFSIIVNCPKDKNEANVSYKLVLVDTNEDILEKEYKVTKGISLIEDNIIDINKELKILELKCKSSENVNILAVELNM